MSGKLFVLLITAGALMAVGPAAWADGGSVAVQCRQGQGPGCTVAASNQTVIPASSAKVQPASSTDGVCHNSEGKVVPCFIPEFGWLGTAGCYWKVDTGYSPPAWDTADQHQGEQGAWFDFTCLDVRNGTGGGIVWLPTAPGGGLAPPPPVVLAQQATNRLVLFPPAIEASPDPGADQLVNLPTWLWVSGSSWRISPSSPATLAAPPPTPTSEVGDSPTRLPGVTRKFLIAVS